MKNKILTDDALLNECLQFFGKMSASATHEIKNDLSIINESAGLLQDLILMSENGHALSNERLIDISKKIESRVRKADRILKRLNRFSHVPDEPVRQVDLESLIRFMLDLTSRLVEMQGARFNVVSPRSPAQVTTHLFFLQTLIWRSIEAICLKSSSTRQVTVSFETDSSAPGIWFSMDRTDKKTMEMLLESREEKALLAQTGVAVKKEIETNRFGLSWSGPI